jgi:uncharacterized protein YeaO (DUF488 family)
MALKILIKRVYEAPDPSDGYRVLVDRLWPRGLTKEQVHADLWLKEIAPSNALRTWFHHDLEHWDEFKARYFAELDAQGAAVTRLLEMAQKGPLTLLYGARDTQNNQAVAMREYLLAPKDK